MRFLIIIAAVITFCGESPAQDMEPHGQKPNDSSNTPVGQHPDVASDNQVFGMEAFAEHLFQNKDYKAATLEYERLVFFRGDNARKPLWCYRLGICKKAVGQYIRAMENFALVPENTEWSDSARFLSAECALALGRPQMVDSLVSNIVLEKAQLINGYACFLMDEYNKAKNILSAVPSDNKYHFQAKTIASFADSIVNFKKKSYLPAGLLSLIPGLGHVYTGRYGDGLFSFMTVGALSSISAYYNYHGARNRSIALGSLAGVFYLGNVYGALVSVKLFNCDGLTNLKQHATKAYRKE